MPIKSFVPKTLPLASLNWEEFADILGKAHEAIAHYDEALSRANKEATSFLLAKEAVASVESKSRHPTTAEFLKDRRRKEFQPIIHYEKALIFGARWIKDHAFSGKLFCELHKLIRKGSQAAKIDIGKWRNRQNWIGPNGCSPEEAFYFPPKLGVMSRRIENLIAYLHYQDKDPLVQLAIAFAQFLAIHPYMDGNGRVARAMIPLFLYQRKVVKKPMVFMSAFFKENRIAYFQKLYAITEEGKWEEWIHFFLEGLIQECDANRKILNKKFLLATRKRIASKT